MTDELTKARRFQAYKDKLQLDCIQLFGESLDTFAKEHYDDEMPIEDFMGLIVKSIAATSHVTLKGLLMYATYLNDGTWGSDHLEAMVADYKANLEDMEGMREDLSNMLAETVTTHTIN
jgi:hypothetical protein